MLTQSWQQHLKLNTDTLVKIRHLWYLFSRKQIQPLSKGSIEEEIMKKMIEQAFDGNIEDDYVQFYENSYYRELVPQYRWFYTYYTEKYPL